MFKDSIMPKDPVHTINISTLPEGKTYSKNDNDALPMMSYAVTAFKRAQGKSDSPYWKHYANAIAHFTMNYGREAATHLQNLAVNTASGNGDAGESLRNYSKAAIADKRDVNPVVRRLLVSSAEGNDPLNQWTYGFDLPDNQPPSTANVSPVVDRIKSILKK